MQLRARETSPPIDVMEESEAIKEPANSCSSASRETAGVREGDGEAGGGRDGSRERGVAWQVRRHRVGAQEVCVEYISVDGGYCGVQPFRSNTLLAPA